MSKKRTGCTLSLLTAALLAAGPVAAQLLDTQAVTGTLNDVGRQTQAADRALEQAAGEAASSARQAAMTAEARARDAALDPVTRALANPLAALPEALPISDLHGKTALVEVATEDGWRAVAREWLVWLSEAELQALSVPGITLISQEVMPALGMALVRFTVSPALDSRQALEAVLPQALHGQLDRNHTFNSQADKGLVSVASKATSGGNRGSAENSSPPACLRPVRVGMVDTAVQLAHPAFTGVQLHRQDFLPAELAAPEAHGTAVAGLLVGRDGRGWARLPEAHLFAAAAFYGRSDYSQGATTESLIQALNWLLTQRVDVINLSLAGPPNRLLAITIERIAARHIALVAAVGNEGPAAPPLYPAAFDGVIGVTAVDDQLRVYRWANQGEQVDFAALGVSVETARALSDAQTERYGRESGTSMAAPIITAHMACALSAGLSVSSAQHALRQQAIDLGADGRDPVFGDGFIR